MVKTFNKYLHLPKESLHERHKTDKLFTVLIYGSNLFNKDLKVF